MINSEPVPVDLDGARQRILSAARAEFAARGFGAAYVRSIAERAGVTAAMINYYFGGKQALYDTVVAEAQGRCCRAWPRPCAGESREGLPCRLALAYFDFLVEERELQRLLLRQMLDRDEHVRERAREIVGPLRALLEQPLRRSRRRASVRDQRVRRHLRLLPVRARARRVSRRRPPVARRASRARRRHVAELAQLD